MIKIQNLCFKYKKYDHNVIDNLSFDIIDKSINVILGVNGSGKTTLLKLLVGLIDGYKGKIMYDNQNIKDLSYKHRSRFVSYFEQIPTSIDDINIYDFLSFGLANTTKFYQKPNKQKLQSIKFYAKVLKVDNLLEKNINEISVGQRRLVDLCQVLVQETNVIILDEILASLDIVNQSNVLSQLKKINSTYQKTIILSTHNPNHALYLNSNVYLLKDGKFIASGKAGNIVKVDILNKVYGKSLIYSEQLPYKEISIK